MIKYDEHLDDRYGIKIFDDKTIRKEVTASRGSFECIQAICKHFIAHPDPMVVPILNFEIVKEPPEDDAFGVFKYRYDMKRLGMLSEDEKNLITTLTYEKYGYGFSFAQRVYRDSLPKEYPELVTFMQEVFRLDQYLDLHCGNFLKDEDESYKIIDLEGFVLTPFNQPKNDWITR